MGRFCGFCAFFLAASFGSAVGVSAALAASGTPLSPVNGASVKANVKPGFSNGPVTLQWSAEFSTCPGTDVVHDSFPEMRKPGETGWAPQQRDGVKSGAGTFSVDAYVYPAQTTPVIYEWRIRWRCGQVGTEFPFTEGFSAVTTFSVLPLAAPAKCVVPNVKGKTVVAARVALTRSHCRLGTTRQAYSATQKKGRVISHTPAAGARRADQAVVAILVSRGPKP